MNLFKLALVGPLRTYVANLIKKVIQDKLGYDVTVDLNDISIVEEDGKMRASVNIDLETPTEDFYEIIEMLTTAK